MYVDLTTLSRLLQLHRDRQETIAVAGGCFDVVHAGHAALLREAKQLADILIVAINADESVRRLKGPTRPRNSLDDRAAVISLFKPVDYVVAFHEDTPYELLEVIRPDVLVKGEDWVGKIVPEACFAKKTVFLPLLPGRSTTRILAEEHAHG